MTNPPEAAALDEWRDTARFLIDRLDEFENALDDSLSFREWHGHVAPALARFRSLVRENAQPPAEPDQDDADLKTILNAYWPDDGDAYVECPLFAAAKQALTTIKAREVAAIVGWLRDMANQDVPFGLEPMAALGLVLDIAAAAIERGEHRDTRP